MCLSKCKHCGALLESFPNKDMEPFYWCTACGVDGTKIDDRNMRAE